MLAYLPQQGIDLSTDPLEIVVVPLIICKIHEWPQYGMKSLDEVVAPAVTQLSGKVYILWIYYRVKGDRLAKSRPTQKHIGKNLKYDNALGIFDYKSKRFCRIYWSIQSAVQQFYLHATIARYSNTVRHVKSGPALKRTSPTSRQKFGN